MKKAALWLALAACLAMPALAGALTADEVLKLRQAGVSDETIQKMLDQERLRMTAPVPASTQPHSQPLSQASPSQAPSQATPAPASASPPAASNSSVVETQDEVIYRAGQNVPEDIRRMERTEQERERANREMLRNVIIDTRTPPQGAGRGAGQSR